MDLHNLLQQEGKLRIIQEIVPGKQITIAHIIASPDSIVYKKLGLNPSVDYARAAIGIITMTPSETAIIAGDLAIKTANVELGFVDRFSGTLIVTGRLSEVDAAMKEIVNYTKEKLNFTVCEITRT
jgi:ethanolamine utilization protein EutS